MSNSSSQKIKKGTKAVAKDAKVPVAAADTAVKSAAPYPVAAAAIEPVESPPVAVSDVAPSKTSKPAAGAKEKKPPVKKTKLIRDSFTFPETDYALIGALKQRAIKAGKEIKKSEILRAGLIALNQLPDEKLLEVLNGIETLKPGRPSK